MNAKSILRWPVARVLTADKHVEGRVLNRLGVQPMRQIAARALLTLRHALRFSYLRTTGFRQLRRDGLLMVHDFLPKEEFERLRAECLAALDDESVPKADLHHGPTLVRRILLRGNDERLPRAAAATTDARLLKVLCAIEGRNFTPKQLHRAVERVVHGDPAQFDPENALHVDTFYSTHKAWLYLRDVRLEDGPLAVVPKSHALDFELLKRTYRYFCNFGPGRSASRRIADDELAQRRLAEVPMTVPANTLVVANTGGYHRRLRGVEGAVRDSVHVSARSQPFLFWVHAPDKADY